ncbi:Protein abrupt [Gryllus bimaculatus]|nr:Protein abrupt [Gryllus bimaculatus]
MGESVLSLLWEGHTSELATVYTSLLENNFLVDCTISAGGQSLKAHKLVLCACSPYFQRLFLGETGKHTFLILLDATFETLKAVIDFMYRGETQIPQGSLKAFLTLAQTLEIKGLNNHSKNFTNGNVSSNTIENYPGNPSENNEDIAQVPCVSAISEDNPENSSQLHPHCSETSNNAWHSIVNSGEHVAGNLTSEMDQRTPIFGAQDLNQHSNGHKSSFENVQSTEMLPPQQRRRLRNEVMPDKDFDENEESLPPVAFIPINEDCEEPSYVRVHDANERVQGAEPTRGGHNFLQSSKMLHPQQQHLQLGNEVSSARHFVEQEESLPPVVFIPVNEESEEPMDDRYLPVDDANERVEEIESTQSRHNFAEPSSEDIITLDDDEDQPTHQLHGTSQPPDEEPVVIDEARQAKTPHAKLKIASSRRVLHAPPLPLLSLIEGIFVLHWIVATGRNGTMYYAHRIISSIEEIARQEDYLLSWPSQKENLLTSLDRDEVWPQAATTSFSASKGTSTARRKRSRLILTVVPRPAPEVGFPVNPGRKLSDDVIVLEDDEPTHQQSGPRPRSHCAQVTPPAQPSVAPAVLPQTSFNLRSHSDALSRETVRLRHGVPPPQNPLQPPEEAHGGAAVFLRVVLRPETIPHQPQAHAQGRAAVSLRRLRDGLPPAVQPRAAQAHAQGQGALPLRAARVGLHAAKHAAQ